MGILNDVWTGTGFETVSGKDPLDYLIKENDIKEQAKWRAELTNTTVKKNPWDEDKPYDYNK